MLRCPFTLVAPVCVVVATPEPTTAVPPALTPSPTRRPHENGMVLAQGCVCIAKKPVVVSVVTALKAPRSYLHRRF